MTKKFKLLSIGIAIISIFTVSMVFAAHNLYPSTTPSSTYHSLNDIYNLIVNNTTKSTAASATTNTRSGFGGGPGAIGGIIRD